MDIVSGYPLSLFQDLNISTCARQFPLLLSPCAPVPPSVSPLRRARSSCTRRGRGSVPRSSALPLLLPVCLRCSSVERGGMREGRGRGGRERDRGSAGVQASARETLALFPPRFPSLPLSCSLSSPPPNLTLSSPHLHPPSPRPTLLSSA